MKWQYGGSGSAFWAETEQCLAQRGNQIFCGQPRLRRVSLADGPALTRYEIEAPETRPPSPFKGLLARELLSRALGTGAGYGRRNR